IMHGADYDLRLLRKHHEFVPSAVFDTMLAARLLGLRQFSLSHLVEEYLGAKLEKGAQKANWALRPLTERMERYARNDTHYLKPLADIAAAAATAQPVEPLLPRHLSERRRGGLMKAVASGLSISPDHQPKILRPTGRRPSEAERRRFLELQKRRDARAADLAI